MEASLYNAAAEGNIEVFNNKQGLQLESLKTPNQDNVLHVNLATEETVKFSIIKIFSVGFVPAYPKCPSLLFQTNAKGQTPLHVAARYGHSAIVKLLIKSCAKAIDGDLELGMDQVSAVREMLRITDQESNTALHEAAGCGNVEVVKALLEFEVPDFPYSANKKQETPLYIAAKRGDGGVLSVILDKSKSAAHGGPHGRTALHAAAMAGDAEAIRIILEKKGNLTKERDEDGHTPLHYAAHLGSRLSVVEELLKRDVSAAYIGDKKRGMTPLLMAAREGSSVFKRGGVEIVYGSVRNLTELEGALAALIATITFAAVITVPGGLESEKGSKQGDLNGGYASNKQIGMAFGRNRSTKMGPQEPEENISHMDASLYKAAAEGNIEVFNNKQGLQLESLKTPNHDNVLHVNLATQETAAWLLNRFHSCDPVMSFFITMIKREKRSDFIEQILSKCPSLLLQTNAKGQTPLHVAARNGHSAIVKLLIKFCAKARDGDLEKLGMDQVNAVREMLRITDQESNMALHKAARCGNVEVAKALLEFEDPEFPYSANKKQETPLYIAARRRGSGRLLTLLLDKFKSTAHGGPHGRTALHAAAMAGDAEAIKVILNKKGNLTKERDEDGHTPLHYAAHLGNRLSVVKELLKRDVTAAYIGDKMRGMAPLLMAARQGHLLTVSKILSLCPDCCEKVDNKSLNVLHYLAFRGSLLEQWQ
ncbi:hypothetical protein GOBAR_DD25953 [Gossypium barbadense]|nr:hypothetical protein GOBAR_DD25953 [Gossypium barbadense]